MRFLVCISLCIVLLAVAGVGPVGATHGCAFPYVTTDATGAEVRIPADPDRIVTLTPSAAQTMWEIDAFDEVVGTSAYAGYLPGTEETEVVSAETDQAMIERVIDLEPTLVLVPNASHDPAVVDQLRALAIPTVVFAERSSLEDIAQQTTRIGRLTGNCAAGRLRAAQLRATIDAMESATDGVAHPSGLNSFYGYSAGAATFTDDIMRTAGVSNLAATRFAGWQQLSEEVVATSDPEWIIAPEGSPIPDSPAYRSTTAVRTGQIVYLDTNELQQPAPRAVNATATVLGKVHPQVYDELRASGPWYPIDDPPRFETATATRAEGVVTVTVRPATPVAAVQVTPSWGESVTLEQPDATGRYELDLAVPAAAADAHLHVGLQGRDGLSSVRVLSAATGETAPTPPAESPTRLRLLPAVVAALAAPLLWVLVRRRR